MKFVFSICPVITNDLWYQNRKVLRSTHLAGKKIFLKLTLSFWRNKSFFRLFFNYCTSFADIKTELLMSFHPQLCSDPGQKGSQIKINSAVGIPMIFYQQTIPLNSLISTRKISISWNKFASV